MAPSVLYASSPPVVRITLNRPEVKNALNLDVVEQLLAALERAEKEADARVVILQGAGGDFSSGGDITDMVARRGRAVVTYERLKRGLLSIVQAVVRHPRPVLARVDGACIGAGAGLALACDAVLATQTSRFGFPFVKVGLVPDTGTSWLLPHIVGVQAARRLLLTGELVRADEAAGLGLVTKVVPDGAALDQELAEWSDRFAALPPTAVRDTKRLFWDNVSGTLQNAVHREALAQAVRFTTEEHAKAVDGFLNKKPQK